MPDAHQQKHQNVAQRGGQGAGDVRTGLFLERLAHAGNRAGQREGIEHVVAHPRAQTDVPAPPEIAEGDGEIRPLEVRRKLYAEELGDARHQINAAGKIRVLLEGVKQHADDDDRAAVGALVAENRFHQRQGTVGDHLFLEPSPEHQQQAALDTVKVEAVRRDELAFELVKARNRSLNQLREEGDEQRELRRVLLRGVFAVVDVDQVAHRLKGIKADAQRQNQPQRRRAAAQQRRAPRHHGVQILEHGQHAEIQQQHREKPDALARARPGLLSLFRLGGQLGLVLAQVGLSAFADAGDDQRARPCRQRRQGDEGQGGQAAGQIKPVAEQQQQHPAQAQRADVIQRRADKGDSQQDGKRHDSFLSLSNEKSGQINPIYNYIMGDSECQGKRDKKMNCHPPRAML